MSDFTVKSMFREYSVDIGSNILCDELLKVVERGDKLIIDKNVAFCHPYIDGLSLCEDAITINATEDLKSYSGVELIIEDLIVGGFKKNNKLIAIGGGVTQDITSFISSVLYRGVEWVFFPSTLLAQADSCIGSKTSINFGKYKNQIGGFYPPSSIYIDTELLRTLNRSEIASGLGEMCHYFLIGGKEDFDLFTSLYDDALNCDHDALNKLIKESLRIKKEMVERDEFDRGPRNIFNYGHTFGHAIETMSEYAIPHGIAVSIGMDIANYVSWKLNLVEENFYMEVHTFLAKIYAGADLSFLDMDKYLDALKKDKKNQDGLLGLILTSGYGTMFKRFTPCNDRFVEALEEYMTGEYGK